MSIKDFQDRLEDDFKSWIVYTIGVNFLIVLIGISILTFGLLGIPWIVYVDKVPTGFDSVWDFLYNGNIKPFYQNPIYFIFIGVVVIFIGLARYKKLID